MNFSQWLKEQGIDPAKLDEKAREIMQGVYERYSAAVTAKDNAEASKARAELDAQIKTAIAAEKSRADNAEDLAKKAREEGKREERARTEEIEKILKGISSISEEKRNEARQAETVDKAREIVLDAIRSARPEVPAVIVRDAPTGNDLLRSIEIAALRSRGGSQDWIAKEYGEKAMDDSNRLTRSSMGPLGVCRALLRSEGRHVPDNAVDVVDSMREAMGHLPYVLGNIAQKSVLRAYMDRPATWTSWASEDEVADYKTNTAFRFTVADGFSEIHGNPSEIRNTTASDSAETYAAKIYAEGFMIGEKEFVNDDQRVFSQLPTRLGQACQRHVSDKVYDFLLANGTMDSDGIALFNGTNRGDAYGTVSNFITSNGSLCTAYGVTAIDSAVAAFMKLREGNQFIEVDPRILLVPPELASVASSLYSSDLIGFSDKQRGMQNIYKGRFTVVAEPRLSQSSRTGNSATAWYMLPAAGDVDGVKVFWLRGRRGPQVQQIRKESALLNFTYEAVLRYVVDALDWRIGVKAFGA